jgi:hypothetical protein
MPVCEGSEWRHNSSDRSIAEKQVRHVRLTLLPGSRGVLLMPIGAERKCRAIEDFPAKQLVPVSHLPCESNGKNQRG